MNKKMQLYNRLHKLNTAQIITIPGYVYSKNEIDSEDGGRKDGRKQDKNHWCPY